MSSSPPKIPAVLRSTADLARHLGLARTTVSRVINRQPGLKQKTIDRVQRAMAETGFTPNAHAILLKGRRTGMVGICMEDLATPPGMRKLAALQRLLRGRGYSSLIEVFTPGAGRDVVRHFLSLRVEAVAFIGHFPSVEIEARLVELKAHGVPHVVIDHFGLKNAHTVSLDRAAGMVQVMNHLLDLGHRRFGLLGLTQGPSSRIDRLSGIQSALAARRLEWGACTMSLDHQHERRIDFDYGRNLARSFLTVARRPTAFVGYNDEIAIGALRGFEAAGVNVPGDVSLTGFNHQEICRMTWPTLTSVDQCIDATITAAADTLFAQFEKPDRQRPIVRTIEPQLMVGESTGPAR